jgi:hypothetical protein
MVELELEWSGLTSEAEVRNAIVLYKRAKAAVLRS